MNIILHRFIIYINKYLFHLLLLLTRCAVDKGKIYEKDGKLYGKTDGLFKAKWEDYYLRGTSYSEGGFWEDAVADFAQAMEKRRDDQRRARTYGMHFIDYFPNRELGIAYFNLKRFKEAIKALETSLASVETARAKFYLDKARRAWLDETRLDTIPPAVSVNFPPPVYRTKDFSVSVKGMARDDYFVSNIIFNGKSSKLELSRKEVSFQEDIALQHGKNVITLQSEDILGKTSVPLTIQVKVDREGPLVFLEVLQSSGNTITVTGAVYDTSTITGLVLNNRDIITRDARFMEVHQQFTLSRTVKTPFLQFEATDSVGNKTRGTLECSRTPQSTTSFSIMTFPQVASSKNIAPEAKSRSVFRGSKIAIRGLRDGLTLYRNTLTLEGTVRTGDGIENLIINRHALLSAEEDPSITPFLKLLKEKKGRPLAFSKTIQLEEGENTITASLTDTGGTVNQQDFTINRNIPSVRQVGSRLSVAIIPFIETSTAKETVRSYVQTFLNHSFVDQKRFNVLARERLNTTLDQENIARNTAFDQETAVRLGRLMGSETVLLGNISTSEASIEITALLLDTETASIITEKDVYWEGKVTAGFREILDRLALKFKQHIPLCEGTITDEKPGNVVIDLGSDRSIHQGMKFLAFRNTDPLIDPETGMNLGSDTDIIALLSAKEVDQTFSKTDVLKKFGEREIQTGNRVIAK